jgi:hypothetical protein
MARETRRSARDARIIFLSHPQLFRESAGGWHALAAALPPPRWVRHVQHEPGPGQHFPNRATRWVLDNIGPICDTRLALHDGVGLYVVDLLVRQRRGGCVAVFFLFGDGSEALYRRAVRFVQRARRVCSLYYAFSPEFLLMHLTARGVLRRKWVRS